MFGIGHVIFKELLYNKFVTPKERVSYPDVYDSNFWNPSMIAHVISKELLCNKLDTPKEWVSYPDISDSNF